MDIELLKNLIKENESQDKTEKLSYIKSLEEIKFKLRQQLIKLSNENFGQWFLSLEKDTFCTTSNLEPLFENATCKTAKSYFASFEDPDKIKTKISQMKNREQISFERDILLGDSNHIVQEKITYLESENLYIGAIKDMTNINKITQNISNIDKTIYNMVEIFDKNIILIQCNEEGNITYVSSAFFDVSHYQASKVIGANINDFQAIENTNVLKILKMSLKQSKTKKCELQFKKSDSKTFWVKAFISPITNADGNISYTLVCYDITGQKILETITNYDALTGVYNRRYYMETINKEINRCKRDGKILSFAMIDIDFFKQYNDTYGHREGDAVLKQVAHSLQNNLKRGDDYLFRMGGEEFCAIFSGYDEDKSLEFCRKLKNDIEALQIPHIGNRVSDYVTISIGLVVSNLKNEVIDELGLYTTSDNALYSAKMGGRNKIFIHPQNSLDLF